jgi:guanylate kinase
MEVVSLEAAQQMRAAGQFLVHQEVLGHVYGISSAAVRKLQALGKLPLLDLDRVQDVEQLRAAGFQVRST